MVERSLILKRRRPTTEQIAWSNGVLALDQAERDKLPPHAESYARRLIEIGFKDAEARESDLAAYFSD